MLFDRINYNNFTKKLYMKIDVITILNIALRNFIMIDQVIVSIIVQLLVIFLDLYQL
jgi:hypothetical protein